MLQLVVVLEGRDLRGYRQAEAYLNMFIDSHAHVDGPEFDADREEVIQRAGVPAFQ